MLCRAHSTRGRDRLSRGQKVQSSPFFSNLLPFTPVYSRSLPSAPVCALWAGLPILTSESGELLRGLSGTPNVRSGFPGFDPRFGTDGDQPPHRLRPGTAAVAPVRRSIGRLSQSPPRTASDSTDGGAWRCVVAWCGRAVSRAPRDQLSLRHRVTTLNYTHRIATLRHLAQPVNRILPPDGHGPRRS